MVESFLGCRDSSGRTTLSLPFGGPWGPAARPLASLSGAFFGGERSAAGKRHNTFCMNAGGHYSDECDSSLSSHLHYKLCGIILGLQRKQLGTGKANLQGSSGSAFLL